LDCRNERASENFLTKNVQVSDLLTNNEKEGGGEAKNRQQNVLHLTDLPNLTAELRRLLFICRHISSSGKSHSQNHRIANQKTHSAAKQVNRIWSRTDSALTGNLALCRRQ
jgi:hypothetical protein